MRLEEVEFDREAEVEPVEVELVPLDVEAGGVTRQAGLGEQAKEQLLRVRAGEGGRLVDGERAAEASGAAVALVAGQRRFDRPQVEEVQLFAALEDPLQPTGLVTWIGAGGVRTRPQSHAAE